MSSEQEIKDILKIMLLDKDLPSMQYAAKFCEKALYLTGIEFKSQCLYILGNSLEWTGKVQGEMKVKIRKFVFSENQKVKKEIQRL